MDDIVVLAVKCDVAVWSVFEFFRIFDILWHGLSVGEIRVKFLEVEMYLCDLPLVLTVTHLPVKSRHDIHRIITDQSTSVRMHQMSFRITVIVLTMQGHNSKLFEVVVARCFSLQLSYQRIVSNSGSVLLHDPRNVASLDPRCEISSGRLSFFDPRNEVL